MQARGALVGAAATALTMVAGLGGAAAAHASDYGHELNGTYTATSNGDFAKVDNVYIDQATIRETWQITTSCSDPFTCSGEVVSDQGWTEPIRFSTDRWIIERDLANWIPCANGTTAPGHQMYTFWGVDENGQNNGNPTSLAGRNKTKGPSGACGKNRALIITQPLSVEKVS